MNWLLGFLHKWAQTVEGSKKPKKSMGSCPRPGVPSPGLRSLGLEPWAPVLGPQALVPGPWPSATGPRHGALDPGLALGPGPRATGHGRQFLEISGRYHPINLFPTHIYIYIYLYVYVLKYIYAYIH